MYDFKNIRFLSIHGDYFEITKYQKNLNFLQKLNLECLSLVKFHISIPDLNMILEMALTGFKQIKFN